MARVIGLRSLSAREPFSAKDLILRFQRTGAKENMSRKSRPRNLKGSGGQIFSPSHLIDSPKDAVT